jgi:hypothetical protein
VDFLTNYERISLKKPSLPTFLKKYQFPGIFKKPCFFGIVALAVSGDICTHKKS